MSKCVRTKLETFCRYTTVRFEVASTFLVAPNHRSQRQSAILPMLLVIGFSGASPSNHEHVAPNFALFIFYSGRSAMEIPWNVLPSDYRCKQLKHSTKDFRTLLLNANPPPGGITSVLRQRSVFPYTVTYIHQRLDSFSIHRHFSIIFPHNTRINFAHVKHHLLNSAFSPSVIHALSIHICTPRTNCMFFHCNGRGHGQELWFWMKLFLKRAYALKRSTGSWHVCVIKHCASFH